MIGHPQVEEPTPGLGGCRWRPMAPDWSWRESEFFRTYPCLGVRDASDGGESGNTVPAGIDPSPRFVTLPPERAWTGEEYIYQPRAFDPASDGFTWRLDSSVPGMTVDRHSGRIFWKPGKSATADIVLSVRNVHGAESSQTWTLRARHPGVLRPTPADLEAVANRPRYPDRPCVLLRYRPWPTSRTLPDGSTERFLYDGYGRQTRHVSFEGRVTYFEYDALDRLAGRYFYNSEADWQSRTVAQSIVLTYDALGRVVREVDSVVGTAVTTYNQDGAVSRIASPQGVINYEYDRVTGQVTRTWTGTDAARPITDVRNTYDLLGRLDTVATHAREGAFMATLETAKYVYDIIGNLDRVVHANGVVSDYRYDELNRLKELTHYAPDATPEDLTDNAVLQRYSYDYHKDGNKSKETFTDASGAVHTWSWVYDQLGRLVRETHDNADDSLDYDTVYKYDLVGNRLEKATDTDLDGVIDELVKSQFDQNDRLLNELKVFSGVQTERTDYIYNKTEQIAKTVTNLLTSDVESKTSMSYNAQGRLSEIVIEAYTGGIKTQEVRQSYVYDSDGIKVRQVETVDADADGVIDATRDTGYLNDKQNHTGYSQVLEERTVENGQDVKVTTYTIGHDVLAQFSQALGYLALLADGHGSTRAVTNDAGQIVQQYNYDAYGNAHDFKPSEAMTNLLYSGEQFNPVSGLQYLRARWYNPQSGRFNRLDPYSGDQQSPLSFHKYAYANMNPIGLQDPSGLFSIAGITVSLGTLGKLAVLTNITIATAYSAMGVEKDIEWMPDAGAIGAVFQSGDLVHSQD